MQKVRKKQKQNIYCSYLFSFRGNKSALCVRIELYKVVIAGGSNNAGERALDVEEIFTVFFPQNTRF